MKVRTLVMQLRSQVQQHLLVTAKRKKEAINSERIRNHGVHAFREKR